MSDDNDAPAGRADVAGRAAKQVEALLAEGLTPGLHIVATPIGNLGDISLRALSALACADILLCEDTRRARTLLTHFGIRRDLQVYEDHSAERVRPGILAKLAAGGTVVLISDAGTPLISDPGFKLVREAVSNGVPVHTAPGPVAAVAALTLSGLPSDSFFFAGFLPPKAAARRQRLAELASIDSTLILYESTTRLAAVLQDMASVLGARPAVVIREMTKRFETHYRGTLEELHAKLSGQQLKGEIVIVVAPPEAQAVSDEVIKHQLELGMKTMTPKDAVDWVASVLQVQRKRVYGLMIALRRDP